METERGERKYQLRRLAKRHQRDTLAKFSERNLRLQNLLRMYKQTFFSYDYGRAKL
jgi:hypothetical protein